MIKKLALVGLILIIVAVSLFFGLFKSSPASQTLSFASVSTTNLPNVITASGDVEAQNQANLTFLTSGRVAHLGVKKGDSVTKGQTLANLDNSILNDNITAAQAQYKSAQSALAKILDDIHLFQYGNGGFANVGSANETQTQKTDREQAEQAVNVAYDNLQSAQTQLQMATIISPFDGKVLSIDNIAEGTNVSPSSASSMTIVGGGELKFVANVLEQDIENIHLGQTVNLTLDTSKDNQLSGTVQNIAGDKTTLPDGSNVIKLEIQSNDLQTSAQAGQTGNMTVTVDLTGITVVPSWVVLANQYVWVMSSNQIVLKPVKVGRVVDGQSAITSGLLPDDQVILDPELIAKQKYKLI